MDHIVFYCLFLKYITPVKKESYKQAKHLKQKKKKEKKKKRLASDSYCTCFGTVLILTNFVVSTLSTRECHQ